MSSGWNLWVWLQCIGVASGCCCKEVYRYPLNNKLLLLIFPTPLVLALFLAAASLLLCSFKKCFFRLYNYSYNFEMFVLENPPYKNVSNLVFKRERRKRRTGQ